MLIIKSKENARQVYRVRWCSLVIDHEQSSKVWWSHGDQNFDWSLNEAKFQMGTYLKVDTIKQRHQRRCKDGGRRPK